MLEALREPGLAAKLSKCVWGARSIEYLGHEIGNSSVSVPVARVNTLRDFHRPTNQKGIMAFLGTACQYQRVIPDFARWADPLFNALKKGVALVSYSGTHVGQMHLTTLSMFFVTGKHLHFLG